MARKPVTATVVAKKPLEQLLEEHRQHRELWGKTFVHEKSGQAYQLLRTVHDTETQTVNAMYCLIALPMLHFTRPMDQFLEKFTVN